MRLKYLSDKRAAALMAIQKGGIPPSLIDYLIALEASYLSHENQRNMEFVEKSWEQFRCE